jgi:hypothetical protein
MPAMQKTLESSRRKGSWPILLSLLLGVGISFPTFGAMPAPDQFVITSIASEGSNLVFNATIPAGLGQVTLERRPSLEAPWTAGEQVAAPADGGALTFTISRPVEAVCFFRLSARPAESLPALVSGEVEYVTAPSLGLNLDNGDAVFHFKGAIDGSDRIVITRAGALWTHVNWQWPTEGVAVNGTRWMPAEKNYMTTTGPMKFLPETFSLEAVELETIQGRDVVAVERADEALVVYLDDTEGGAVEYEFKVRFHPKRTKTALPGTLATTRLKITGEIDGSDRVRITAREATWEHKTFSPPSNVELNGVPWDVRQLPVLLSDAARPFLPPGVDLSSARVVSRKGRDVATVWGDKDALWISFADNPAGSDHYELEISFSR